MRTYLNSKLLIGSIIAGVVAPLVILASSASAAVDTCTWTGGGADNNFNTTGNWNCSVDGAAAVPENGDTLRFDMSVATTNAADTVLNNDIVGLDVAGIGTTGTGSSNFGFTVDGNDITVSGDFTGDQGEGSGFLVLNVNILLASDSTYSVHRSIINFGSYDTIGAHSLNLGAHTFNFTSPEYCGLGVFSSLSGSGNFNTSAASDGVNFRAPHASYTGNIVSNGAGVAVSEDAIGAGSTITINGSGRLYFADVATYGFDAIMNSSGDPAVIAAHFGFACAGGGGPTTETTTLSGDLTLQRSTVFQGIPHNLNVTGTFTANGHALTTKTGSAGSITTTEGTVETEATTTTIDTSDKNQDYLDIRNKQTITLNGERGSVFVGSGGVLKGTGTVGDLFVDTGGALAPGLSPGCLSSGNLSLNGTFQAEIAGVTVCTEYDQTDVTGTVNVTGGTLEVSFLNNFVPAVNNTFTIINNDGTDAVTGTFTGLANGATFEVAGVTFRINYDGGDGNDVVLTATSVPAVSDTGAEELLLNPATTLVAGLASLAVILGFRRIQKQR